MLDRGYELKSRAEQAAAAYEAGIEKLHRSDGTRRYSEAERKERGSALRTARNTELDAVEPISGRVSLCRSPQLSESHRITLLGPAPTIRGASVETLSPTVNQILLLMLPLVILSGLQYTLPGSSPAAERGNKPTIGAAQYEHVRVRLI